MLGLGASDVVVEELLDYTDNAFEMKETASNGVPEDEPFIKVWRAYAAEAEEVGAFECLRNRLVQFRFSIAQGISATAAYIAATKRGEFPPNGEDLTLIAPDALRIEIHPTEAGHIPLLITENRSDFVSMVRALTKRNEPVPVPDSMGACMVAGYNNWDRVFSYRQEWERNHPQELWEREFESFVLRKELYQDRFILLSDGPYSGVSAEAMGLPDEVWRAASLIIRREHECAHYYTRRVLGSMRNNLFDELIADCMGILEVAGRFRADWFLRFMGLEDFPHYRRGGRFDNYTTGLSTDALRVLRHLLVAAARNLESISLRGTQFSVTCGRQRSTIIRTLAARTLEEIAADSPALDHQTHESSGRRVSRTDDVRS